MCVLLSLEIFKMYESVSQYLNKSFSDDFKPASVDINKPASVDISSANREVTVTLPNFDGAGAAHTVYKGSHKDYTKECVLIIDHTTGEITLEKLTTNVQLKSTR